MAFRPIDSAASPEGDEIGRMWLALHDQRCVWGPSPEIVEPYFPRSSFAAESAVWLREGVL